MSLKKEYKDAVEDREQVCTVLVKAETILKMSQSKRYPGTEPQEPHQSPASFPGHVLLPPFESQPGALGKEAEGLISLGPLGQTQGPANPKGI